LEAMQQGERVSALVALREPSTAEFFVMATRKGFIKKTSLKEYANVRRAGLIAIALRKGDELAWLAPAHKGDRILLATTKGEGIQEVLLITTTGVVIRTPLDQIRVLGRPTMGVKVMATGDAKIASIATFTSTRPTQTQLPVR